MFEHERRVCEFVVGYLEKIVADISEERFFEAAGAGANSPAWICGHIAVVADMGLTLLGKDKRGPDDWYAAFGPQVQPNTMPSDRPARETLISRAVSWTREFAAAAAEADPTFVWKDHELDLLKGSAIRSNGDLLTHLLTAHLGIHVGQLSMVRRAGGKPPLF